MVIACLNHVTLFHYKSVFHLRNLRISYYYYYFYYYNTLWRHSPSYLAWKGRSLGLKNRPILLFLSFFLSLYFIFIFLLFLFVIPFFLLILFLCHFFLSISFISLSFDWNAELKVNFDTKSLLLVSHPGLGELYDQIDSINWHKFFVSFEQWK